MLSEDDIEASWSIAQVSYMKLSYGYMTDLASMLSLSGDMPAAEDQNRCGRATCHQDPTLVQLFVPELKELGLSFVEFSAAPSGTAERSLPAKSTFLDLP